jgi:hypothetical protein
MCMRSPGFGGQGKTCGVLFMPVLPPTNPSTPLVAEAVTRGGGHYFFGYYDKTPWDASGRWILGMEAAFMDRPPGAGDSLRIGMIDTADSNAWIPLAETRAWNWQQGCMLQWLNGGRSKEIIFNDRRDGRLVSRILNIEKRSERIVDRAVYGVNRSGTHAVSLNFARLHSQRPGYGYAGVPDPWANDPIPADDGLYAVDLTTGATRLILSVAEAAAMRPRADFGGRVHRFNHVQFSTDERRFACLHRWKLPTEEVGTTRLLALNIDGSDRRCLADEDMVSHYDWLDNHRVLAWARQHKIGDRYFLFDEKNASATPVGEPVLTCDGHCSFSPDRQWVLTDTYPDATQHRTLLLYHWTTGRRVDLARLFSPTTRWEIRCDLHPRWSPDGQKVCIDSVHEGSRRIYVLNVGEIVRTSPA